MSENEFVAPEVQDALKNAGEKKIILFGCGHDGSINKKALERCGYDIYAFCDNLYSYDFYEGIRVISVEDAVLIEDAFFIVSSRKYRYDMYEQLIVNGVKRQNILLPILYDGLIAGFDLKNQYFDVFTPAQNEIFVDVGCLDGCTTKQFKKWAGEDAKAYMVEASELCFRNISNMIEREHLDNVQLIKGAAWSSNEDLLFSERESAGRVGEQGNAVKGIKLDEVIPDATFIKMDIEGAELEAIKGAEQLILRSRPRMAISIYHKPSDVFLIPIEILKINQDYKFVIRHYSTNRWETVLYAFLE